MADATIEVSMEFEPGTRLGRWVRNKLDTRKYGPLVDSNGARNHVAGPVNIAGSRLLADNVDVTPWVPADLVRGGYIAFGRYTPEDDARLEQAYIDVRDAYLAGEFDIERTTPLNSTVFLLPVREKLMGTIAAVGSLDDVTVTSKGDYSNSHQSVSIVRSPKRIEVPDDQVLAGPDGAEEALRRLAMNRLSCGDYSDWVGFKIDHRMRPAEDGGYISSRIIDRDWSKENQDDGGRWRPVDWGTERIVISGKGRSPLAQ